MGSVFDICQGTEQRTVTLHCTICLLPVVVILHSCFLLILLAETLSEVLLLLCMLGILTGYVCSPGRIITSEKHTIVLWWPSAVTLFLWLCSSKCQFLLHCSLCEALLPVRVKLQRRSVWGSLDTTATFSVMQIL